MIDADCFHGYRSAGDPPDEQEGPTSLSRGTGGRQLAQQNKQDSHTQKIVRKEMTSRSQE
jgi:hypothetical protein